jgi:hypothetical protein
MMGKGPVGVEYVHESLTSFANPMDVSCGPRVWITDGTYSTSATHALRVIW